MSQEKVSEMFNDISPSYDRVNRVLSFGIDQRWRQKMVPLLPKSGTLLDIATGTCDQLLTLAPHVQSAVGLDPATEMLFQGQKKIDASPFASKLSLQEGSALDLPYEDASFDCTTISFGIRNVGEPLRALAEMHRVLKLGGRALILEFSMPQNPLIRFPHLVYLRKVLPAIGGLLSKNRPAYEYLNQTIEAFPFGETFCSLMQKAGFERTQAIPLTFGVATLYVGEK